MGSLTMAGCLLSLFSFILAARASRLQTVRGHETPAKNAHFLRCDLRYRVKTRVIVEPRGGSGMNFIGRMEILAFLLDCCSGSSYRLSSSWSLSMHRTCRRVCKTAGCSSRTDG